MVDRRLGVVAPLGIGLAAWRLLRVWQTRYLITSRALWSKRGVIGHTVRRVGLSQVQNTAYRQSLTGSIFGYGTVTVEVAGGRDLTFHRIDDPERVRRMLTDRLGDTDSEIPGTTDQWRAVLSVVRDIHEAVS
ncbi:PH domain-containing protein [Halonotius sp. F2-221B]|uniref:PH domain-containing protein n=1 Tax=Halonotius sp. F2-221B TaxID=2731620 RepID=UPI00398AF3C4